MSSSNKNAHRKRALRTLLAGWTCLAADTAVAHAAGGSGFGYSAPPAGAAAGGINEDGYSRHEPFKRLSK